MLEIIYPGVLLWVVAFAPSKSLRVVRNNSDALVCPALVDCKERSAVKFFDSSHKVQGEAIVAVHSSEFCK